MALRSRGADGRYMNDREKRDEVHYSFFHAFGRP